MECLVLFCSLFAFAVGVGESVGDAATLLQSGASVLPSAGDGQPRDSPDSFVRTYRVMFSKNYGDDHTCFTEIEFYGESGKRLDPTLISFSSCYGCTTCDNCVHRYGNPNALFDKVADDGGQDAWTCTAPGTFTDGLGLQSLVFKLIGRVFKMVLRRPQVSGEWLTREFSLEEQVPDGSWWVIMSQEDAPRELNQELKIDEYPILDGRRPDAAWFYKAQDEWVHNWQTCGTGREQSPIDLEPMPDGQVLPEANKLPVSYQSMSDLALMNTGNGLQVSGPLGNLTLPSGIYEAKQFHFHFPAEHTIGGTANLAVGELHIVHKRVGVNNSAMNGEDLAIVSMFLHLPMEHEELSSEEMFFLDLGMLSIPPEGRYNAPIEKSLSFPSTFANQLNGNYWYYKGSLATPPCVEGVQWLVLQNFAHISGSVVVAFKERMAKSNEGGNARATQLLNGRVPLVNSFSV